MRLDKSLLDRGLVPSRSRAALLIEGGGVSVNGKTILKCAFEVNENDELTVNDLIGYVGRGGLKLEKALESFGVSCEGKNALDIGASTGGFTQCLLRFGAASVTAVDVGHGQMHPSLVADPRVINLENTNARNLSPDVIGGLKDLAVMDVSFISQATIYPALFSCVSTDAPIITLVKPQFEAGSRYLSKKGVIKDKKVYLSVLTALDAVAHTYGRGVTNAMVSPILGGDGNLEFLILLESTEKSFDFTEVYHQALKGV